jgi:ribonucleoside-diphosphate reductase alpha chain
MRFDRKFTQKGSGPYQGIDWVARKSEIRNPDGKAVFHMEGAIVPSTWSQIAVDIIAQKYFRKAGVPKDKAESWAAFVPAAQRAGAAAEGGTEDGEVDARQVFHRLAFTWT